MENDSGFATRFSFAPSVHFYLDYYNDFGLDLKLVIFQKLLENKCVNLPNKHTLHVVNAGAHL